MNDIRAAKIGDLEALLACHALPPKAGLRQWLSDKIQVNSCHLLEREGATMGYIIMEYSFFDLGFISMLCTAPAWRRQGIATALIRFAEELCRTSQIFTSTNQSNETMRTLLGKLDYTFCGEVDNLDPGDPEQFFCRWLDNDSSKSDTASSRE